jgi:transcriptional antiterminator RfaH
MKHWTVAQTESQREHIAADHLGRRGFEVYLPRIKEAPKQIEPLFPGYVFVRVENHWHAINATIGILRVLLAGECPAILPQHVVDELRGREDRRGFVRLPKKTHEPGERVRVLRGMLADHEGIYAGSTPKQRERVLLEILGRMVPIAFEPNDLQFLP